MLMLALESTNAVSLISGARDRQPRYIVEGGSGKLHLMACGRLVKSFVLVSRIVQGWFGCSGARLDYGHGKKV